MLYNFLKLLFTAGTRLFFRRINISNVHLIPSKGPVLLLANHPSSFMDPILIALSTKRKVHFLAKASVFNSAFAKWLFPKFNMIPVYRKQDDPNLTHKNEETFEECYKHFEKGGVILMFPEGISLTERKLRKIKTGAARIALGAEARNNFSLGVKIVPIGLNYSDANRFRSKVLMNIDEPIPASDFKEEYTKEEFKAAEVLTERIRASLEKHIIAFEDDFSEEMAEHVELLYKNHLAKELDIQLMDQQEDFRITKIISESVNYFYERDPERVYNIKSKTDYYLNNLKKIGLKDKLLGDNRKNDTFFLSNFKTLSFLILGAPFFLYGFINNIIPFRIPFIITRKFVSKTEFKGAIGMAAGTIVFLIFYSLQGILFHHYIREYWLLALYLLSLPFSGLFAFLYYLVIKKLRSKWFFITLFYKRSSLVSNLVQLRQEIIKELDKARREYENK